MKGAYFIDDEFIDFIEKRFEQIGLSWNDLKQDRFSSDTMHRLKSRRAKKVYHKTIEKLSEILYCGVDELIEHTAERPNMTPIMDLSDDQCEALDEETERIEKFSRALRL